MAITIRNKETEDMIKQLGARWGQGSSAVISRLARTELAKSGIVSAQEFDRRMRILDDLAREFPPQDPKPSWEQLEADMQEMFDYLDEECAQP